MRLMTGKSLRVELENNQYLDVSIYPGKWTTHVSMNRWEKGNSQALSFHDVTYLNFERFLPKKRAENLTKHLLNKHAQKVANIDLIPQ